MSEWALIAEEITKAFYVFKYSKSALSAVRRLINGDAARRQQAVLQGVSCKVRQGENIGIVGRNGAGKSTFLRIIAGIYAYDSGSIWIAKRPAVMFDVSVGMLGLLNVEDNIFLFGAMHGFSRDFLKPRVDEILDLAGLQHSRFTPYRDLSTGQRRRLSLSIFLLSQRSFMIFDEVLTNLDIGFVKACESYFSDLKNSDKTVILTSHDSEFLRRYCDRGLWLEDGRIILDGPMDEVLEQYEKMFQTEQ